MIPRSDTEQKMAPSVTARCLCVLYVLGPIFLLGGAGLGPTKVVYFAAALAVSWAGLSLAMDRVPVLLFVGLLSLVVGVGFSVDLVRGNDVATSLRTVGPLCILTLSPFAGLWIRDTLSASTIRRLLVIAGYSATLLLAANWISRRGLSEQLSAAPLQGGNAVALIILVMCMDAALLLSRNLSPVVAVRLPVAMGLLAATGTRSLLLLILSVALLAVVSLLKLGVTGQVPLVQALLVALTLVAVGWLSLVFTPQVLSSDILDFERTIDRLSDVSFDAESIALRQGSSGAAWQAASLSPLTGLGHAASIEVPVYDGSVRSTITPDSSLIAFVRLGFPGALLIVLIVGFSLRQLGFKGRTWSRTDQLVLLACSANWFVVLVLNNLVDDRGVPIVLAALTAVPFGRLAVDGRLGAEEQALVLSHEGA